VKHVEIAIRNNQSFSFRMELKLLLHLRLIDFLLHLTLLFVVKLHLVEYYSFWRTGDIILLLIAFLLTL